MGLPTGTIIPRTATCGCRTTGMTQQTKSISDSRLSSVLASRQVRQCQEPTFVMISQAFPVLSSSNELKQLEKLLEPLGTTAPTPEETHLGTQISETSCSKPSRHE